MSALVERPKAPAFVLKEGEKSRDEFWTDFGFTRDVADELGVKQLIERAGDASPAKNVKEGDAILRGYASTWVMDRDFEFIGRHAFDGTLEAYLKNNPIILLQHNHDWALGQTIDSGTDNTGLAMVGWVRQPQQGDPDWKHGAYNDIIAGIYRTFSIGGFFTREIVDGEIFISEIDLFEISVVAVPSNPLSIFEAAQKSVRGLGMRKMHSQATEQLEQLLGFVEMTDPQLMRMDDRQKLGRYHELAATFTHVHGTEPPAYDAWTKFAAKLGDPDADPVALAAECERLVEKLYQPRKARTRKDTDVSTEDQHNALKKIEGATKNTHDALSSVGYMESELPATDESITDDNRGKALDNIADHTQAMIDALTGVGYGLYLGAYGEEAIALAAMQARRARWNFKALNLEQSQMVCQALSNAIEAMEGALGQVGIGDADDIINTGPFTVDQYAEAMEAVQMFIEGMESILDNAGYPDPDEAEDADEEGLAVRSVKRSGGAKAGRVLSKKNEGKLRSATDKAKAAIEDVQAVLDQVAQQEEDEAEPDKSKANMRTCSSCGHQQAAYKDNCDECGKPMKSKED